jgi:hypothetical protein
MCPSRSHRSKARTNASKWCSPRLDRLKGERAIAPLVVRAQNVFHHTACGRGVNLAHAKDKRMEVHNETVQPSGSGAAIVGEHGQLVQANVGAVLKLDSGGRVFWVVAAVQPILGD